MKPSGMMHCWLAAKAELLGKTYICLRGVNWDPEKDYDKRHLGVEHNKAFNHVPSVKFPYDPKKPIPGRKKARKAIAALVANEWPALQSAKRTYMDQELTGALGGYPIVNQETGERRFDAVTRVFYDFGKVNTLPNIMLKPNAKLPFPRHPVFWVKAKDIGRLKQDDIVQQGNQISPFAMIKNQTLQMERPEDRAEIVMASGIVLQNSVAQFFEKNGVAFTPTDKRELARPFIKTLLYLPNIVCR